MVYIIGHRGAPIYLPENTIESFKKAIEIGVDFIECDIHLTKDEKIVIIHDATVDRTTDGKGYVRDFTLDELRQLHINNGSKIPTIEEVLELDFPVVIELKSYSSSGTNQIYPNLVGVLLKVLREVKFSRDVIFISFDRRYLEEIKDFEYKKGFLSFDFPNLDRLENLNLSGIGVYYKSLDSGKVEIAHNKGLSVIAWTVDRSEDIEIMVDMGVDLLASNDPILAIETIR